MKGVFSSEGRCIAVGLSCQQFFVIGGYNLTITPTIWTQISQIIDFKSSIAVK